MALKSSREGLRKELVDYLGNIIIDENLKQNIINSIDDVFINNEELSTAVNGLDDKIRNETSARESTDTTLQEAITNIENLINNGVLKVDLLWTNADVSTDFPAQRIYLDLSNYKLLIIEYVFSTTSVQYIGGFVINKGVDVYCINVNPSIKYRAVNASDTHIYFYNSYHSVSYGSEVVDNSLLIPYKIHGVR